MVIRMPSKPSANSALLRLPLPHRALRGGKRALPRNSHRHDRSAPPVIRLIFRTSRWRPDRFAFPPKTAAIQATRHQIYVQPRINQKSILNKALQPFDSLLAQIRRSEERISQKLIANTRRSRYIGMLSKPSPRQLKHLGLVILAGGRVLESGVPRHLILTTPTCWFRMAPGAVALGSLGLAFAGWLRRRKMTS